MALLRQAGAFGLAVALCRDIAEQYPEAVWAQRQLGMLLLRQGDAEGVIAALQVGIRGDASHAGAWEGLGAAYQALGRLSAALKVCHGCTLSHLLPTEEHMLRSCLRQSTSICVAWEMLVFPSGSSCRNLLRNPCMRAAQAFERALELDPGRLYSRSQAGAIHMALGAYADAKTAFEAALGHAPKYPPAHCGAAAALLAAAKQHIFAGAQGACWPSSPVMGMICNDFKVPFFTAHDRQLILWWTWWRRHCCGRAGGC